MVAYGRWWFSKLLVGSFTYMGLTRREMNYRLLLFQFLYSSKFKMEVLLCFHLPWRATNDIYGWVMYHICPVIHCPVQSLVPSIWNFEVSIESSTYPLMCANWIVCLNKVSSLKSTASLSMFLLSSHNMPLDPRQWIDCHLAIVIPWKDFVFMCPFCPSIHLLQYYLLLLALVVAAFF